MNSTKKNIDHDVVSDFGKEWARFSQGESVAEELKEIFEKQYFLIFPFDELPKKSIGADIGCGSGRWAKLMADRVHHLHLVDASENAIEVAKKNLKEKSNITYHLSSVDEMPILDKSLDFAYSLGVLHHVPDTAEAIKSITRKLKTGAPLLLYLYYAFDNQPLWYRNIWRLSEVFRGVISKLPTKIKTLLCDLIAICIYWPMARTAALLNRADLLPRSWPLAAYKHLSFYTMRTDALDRFGTRLEQRFTRQQITVMLESAGLEKIKFNETIPYWVSIGYKK